VPFNFLRRRKTEGDASGPGPLGPAGLRFDALTDEWRLTGLMHVDGRLSDVLNRRVPIALSGVAWSPLDGSAGFTDAPGVQAIDPYDVIIALAGSGSLPELTDDEQVARRVRKLPYRVALEAPPFRVVGVAHLRHTEAPDRMIDDATTMFIPLTEAQVRLNGALVAGPMTVLVNRLYVRGVEQVT